MGALVLLALFVAAPATALSFRNPVSGPTADPEAIRAGGEYYLYATGDGFPIQRSRDLVHWTAAGTAFRSRPKWVVRHGNWHPWAPSVLEQPGACPANTHERPTGSCFYMYYTGVSAQFDENCIAVASSTSPLGPFVDQGPLSNGTPDARGRPIGCGDNAGYGNIDAAPFVDGDGQEYVYVSTDFTCAGGAPECTGADSVLAPTISVMAIAPDHIGVLGGRVGLFSGTMPWEASGNHMTVEGPWMDRHDGIYHLFFSGGDWNGDYGEGDATLQTPLGPAVQDPANPILTDTNQVFSPGGGSTIIGPHGGDWLVYHARLGSFTAPRQLFIDPILWGPGGSVSIDGPTVAPRPADAADAAAPRTAASRVVRVGGPAAGAPAIPAGFTGLSFELTALDTYAGHSPTAINPVFEQLVRNIAQGGRPVLRLGGDSTDWSWYPVPGMARPPWVRYEIDPDWLNVLRAVAAGLEARLIVGINFEADSARIAGAEANAVIAGVGRKAIAALELGNEPELYSGFAWYQTAAGVGVKGRGAGWDPSTYSRQFATVARQLPRVPLAGPATGSHNWIPSLGSFLAANRSVKIATLHRYPLVRCTPTTHVTAAQLLARSSSDGLAASVAPYVAVARRYGDALRIGEMNAVSCGGEPGLSNTFATALWAPDALFAMARAGVAGVNIHTTPGYVNQLFSFSQSPAGAWSGRVAPLYYGLLLFAQAAPAGARILDVAGDRDPALRVWATRASDGSERVLLIDTGSASQTVKLAVAGLSSAGSLERLTAPGLSATSAITLGGQSFGPATATGKLAGTRTLSTVTPARGVYQLALAGDSAELLTVRGSAYPLKP